MAHDNADAIALLRREQHQAENMARLSPFHRDRDRFHAIAERARIKADTLAA